MASGTSELLEGIDPVTWCQAHFRDRVWSTQAAIMRDCATHDRVAVKAGHGVGKLLALDTPLPTPLGWTTMGAVQVGDEVYDETGQPTRVTYVSPVDTSETCYRLTFSDGSELVAGASHQWVTWTHRDRVAARRRKAPVEPAIKLTSELAATLHHESPHGQRINNHSIPATGALEGRRWARTRLPVSPYTLGVWLGDGTASDGTLTLNHADAPEILAGIEAEKFFVRVVPSSVRAGCSTYRVVGLREKLGRAGLLGNKHVPAVYQRASQRVRLALVQGLMDSDGTISTRSNRAEFMVMREVLADAMDELLCGLGLITYRSEKRARLNGRDYGTAYRVGVTTTAVPLFRLKRQLARVKRGAAQDTRRTHRFLVACEKVPTVPTRCISVDSPNSMYLAGRTMIATHNTWLAARAALFRWLTSDGAILITTAPTFRQVDGLLWREIRAADRASRNGGIPLAPTRPAPRGPKWDAYPRQAGRWLALGIAAGRSDSLQGWHDRTLIAVIDEAAGVEPWVWDAVLAFQPSFLLAIGNPTDSESHFAKCFDSPRWKCHTIPVLDSPNLTGEAERIWGKQHPALVNRAWVEEVSERYGEQSAYWQSRVLANFPDQGADSLVPGSWYDAARAPLGHPHRWRTFGVDLAKFGGDQTVVAVWDEACLTRLIPLPPSDLMQTTGRIVQLIEELRPGVVGVDDTGLVGVCDRLRELGHPAVPIVPGAGPEDGERYGNLRVEMAWTLREALRAGDAWIGGDWPTLREEMRQTRYEVSSNGKLRLEAKEKTKERLGRSPDHLDAAMYGFWVSRDEARRHAMRRPGARVEAVPRGVQAHHREAFERLRGRRPSAGLFG